MKKRMTDADKWTDPWFYGLDNKYRMFWLYLLDNCDHAGFWQVNMAHAMFTTKSKLNAKNALSALSGHVEDLGNGYWWVTGFCQLQYVTLSERSEIHRNVMRKLSAMGVLSQVTGKETLTQILASQPGPRVEEEEPEEEEGEAEAAE
jgi:hypothetical protein